MAFVVWGRAIQYAEMPTLEAEVLALEVEVLILNGDGTCCAEFPWEIRIEKSWAEKK